ncbi:MAG: hypothetical protein Q7J68_07300 [Thermoplasmata archaeon]|nr:hypothetical protein [Thermoplasmata archaeon]
MKPEGHLQKAEAFERRARKWDGTEDEVPSVVEDVFNAAVHYLAYGINIRYGQDIDGHGMQKKFLREKKEYGIWQAYQDLESVRVRAVYGASWNCELVESALLNLEAIKIWSK